MYIYPRQNPRPNPLKITFLGLKLTRCPDRLMGCLDRALQSRNRVSGNAVQTRGRPIQTGHGWNNILEMLPSIDQQLRAMSICGPIELKFCRDVHNTWIYIMNGGDWILSILYQCLSSWTVASAFWNWIKPTQELTDQSRMNIIFRLLRTNCK